MPLTRLYLRGDSTEHTHRPFLLRKRSQAGCLRCDETKGTGKDGRRANLSDEFIEQLKAKIKLEYIFDGKGDF